ncbi:hypothetical protein [Marinimicrobium locisalis]|uniref:hypothetical protein n=1 Tax=Marinimicrobium locisalis TaxID=546022 RepID=UPI003221C36D
MSCTKALLALIPLTLIACQAQGVTYREATESYCDLYDPAAWSEVDNQDSLQEVYGYIASKSMDIENDQFRSDLKSMEVESFSGFHKAIHRTFESRLGRSWQCDSFEDFFFPKQKVVELLLGKEAEKHINPSAPNTLVLTLSASGDVLIDNKPLSDTSLETISKAIDISLPRKGDSVAQVYLYLEEGVDAGNLFDIITLLKNKNVESVGLIGHSKS